jgi:hypothetical protein
MRRLPALLLPLLALLVLAAPARAAGPEIGIADDRILLAGGPEADRAIDEWQALGVDSVRILALWSRHAPEPASPTPPPGFDARDPNAPGYAWGMLDDAVRRVRAAGMSVMLTVTGPGPLWASSVPALGYPLYRPSSARYADFATAVARRYAGDVDRYTIWNEPNLPSWLQPQAVCRGRRCIPESPHLYRNLVLAAYPAIRAADPGATVLIGTTSSRGHNLRSRNATMRPLTFLRALGCVSVSFRRTRGGACRGFRPVPADGFAYHPHGQLTPPAEEFADLDDANIASLPRLVTTLDRMQRAGALRPSTRRMNIFFDEYGYQTNPPDRAGGVSPARQDLWMQQGAYLAWRNPRVRLVTQYLWADEPVRQGSTPYAGWQSGLRFVSGRAKPSLAHFDTPFAVDAARNRLWGQVRPGGAHVVTVQRRARGSSSWLTFATARTDARGYWSIARRLKRGTTYRFQAAGATSAALRR